MKEPLILLPGMMCDARLFTPQVSAFSSKRPIMVAPLIGEQTMAGIARNVLACAPSSFALAGLSMGGIVAMEIIRQAPERVTRLALMDTNPLADPPEKAAERVAQVKQVRSGLLTAVMRDQMKPNYLADGPERSDILDLCMAMAGSLGAAVFEDQSVAIQHRPDQRETLMSVEVPSLILCGEQDSLCPVSHHEMMADLISGSQLVVVPGAGHLPTLERPAATNRALDVWLSA